MSRLRVFGPGSGRRPREAWPSSKIAGRIRPQANFCRRCLAYTHHPWCPNRPPVRSETRKRVPVGKRRERRRQSRPRGAR